MAIGVNVDGVNCIEEVKKWQYLKMSMELIVLKRLRIEIADNVNGVNCIEEVMKWQQLKMSMELIVLKRLRNGNRCKCQWS